MWETNDKKNYLYHLKNNKGQICNDSFSKEIIKYASNLKYKTFLEIGTWKGSSICSGHGYPDKSKIIG